MKKEIQCTSHSFVALSFLGLASHIEPIGSCENMTTGLNEYFTELKCYSLPDLCFVYNSQHFGDRMFLLVIICTCDTVMINDDIVCWAGEQVRDDCSYANFICQ